MAEKCYKKFVGTVFGFTVNEDNPITDAAALAVAVEAALSTLPAEQKEAVEAVCFNGVDKEAVDASAYAMALRSLRHPSCSRTFRPYVNFYED